MERKRILVFSFFVFFISFSSFYAQSKTDLFPSELNIQPYTANFLEPKLGFVFQLNRNELRLDIGNSLDILHVNNSNSTLSFGADLFTYTMLRGEKDFHFPVDAVDYLFGFNFGYKLKLENNREAGARIRVSHISAHFADGHFDGINHQWRDGKTPRVFSREFIEFIPYYKFNSLRVYGGFTYLIHVDPIFIGKDIYHAGFDFFDNKRISENITPFAAYDLRIVDINGYNANHTISIGLKFGKPQGKGFSIYLNYYNGMNIHGEYFDSKKEYSALGFNLDL